MSSLKGIFLIVMLCVLISIANKALNLTSPNGTEVCGATSFIEDTLPALLIDLKSAKDTLAGMLTPLSSQIVEAPENKHLSLEKPPQEKDGMSIQYKRHKRHLYYSYDGEHWTKYY